VIRQMLLVFSALVTFATTILAQEPNAPVTLDRVVQRYIQNNLDLQVARYRLERTRADQIAARLRPNPGLTLGAEKFRLSGPTPFDTLYEVTTIYTETIELGGKRRLRERAADLTVSTAEAQFADTMRRGVAVVKRLYYEALLARYNVEVANENSATFADLLRLNQVRFEEGAIPEVDLIKVRLERMKFESAARQAELNYRQAVIRLLERLGESTFARVDVAGELDVPSLPPSLESLREIALQERADIQAAAREVDASSARISLEQARGKPDISPFVGYTRVGPDNTVLFGVNIPLRVRDRNQAGIARADADAKVAETQLQLVKNRALAEVEVAYESYQTARDLVQAFRDQLLGQADESRMIALAAYEEGGTDLLPFLDAQRTRSEVRQQYFKTLLDYRSSIIDLELAVGREIQP
jgi:outer membrane protein, heavy metal efflux system